MCFILQITVLIECMFIHFFILAHTNIWVFKKLLSIILDKYFIIYYLPVDD